MLGYIVDKGFFTERLFRALTMLSCFENMQQEGTVFLRLDHITLHYQSSQGIKFLENIGNQFSVKPKSSLESRSLAFNYILEYIEFVGSNTEFCSLVRIFLNLSWKKFALSWEKLSRSPWEFCRFLWKLSVWFQGLWIIFITIILLYLFSDVWNIILGLENLYILYTFEVIPHYSLYQLVETWSYVLNYIRKILQQIHFC